MVMSVYLYVRVHAYAYARVYIRAMYNFILDKIKRKKKGQATNSRKKELRKEFEQVEGREVGEG